jgi:hypothetical protein
MAVTVFCDLPLASDAEPTLTVRGIWPSESEIADSPFTMAGEAFAEGAFTADIGTPGAGLYRCAVELSGVLIATGYVLIEAGTTNVRMVDSPQAAITPSDFASAIASAVAASVTSQLLTRFTVTQAIGTPPQIATIDVSRAERLALGRRYVGAVGAYTKADVELVIGVAQDAPDITGRLVWTAKNQVTDADSVLVIKVDSVSGLVKPTGGGIVVGDGTLAAIDAGDDPDRSARLKVYARGMAGIPAGRLYWDLRQYIDATQDLTDVLATGILDLALPINQAVA